MPRQSVLYNPWFQLFGITGVLAAGITILNFFATPLERSPSASQPSEPSETSQPSGTPTSGPRHYIGVLPRQVEPREHTEGVVVEGVIPDSPATEAQLRKGDVIRKFDGRDVQKLADLQWYASQTQLNKKVELQVDRNGQPLNVMVQVKQQPSAPEMFKKFLAAAERGDADAQTHLALMFYRGEGVAKDIGEAVKWWTKAAEQGVPEAQGALGLAYYNGEGVPKDFAEAAQWLRKAAEQGQAVAQYNLGSLYYSGQGVSKDPAEATKWFRKAAEQGHPLAQYFLGSAYYTGVWGLPKDLAAAARWFQRAAEQGEVGAQNQLGLLYYNGEGVSKDVDAAVKWWTKAAEQGHAGAQNNLGLLYYTGEGVPKDLGEAAKWWAKAAEKGNENAIKMLRKVQGSEQSENSATERSQGRPAGSSSAGRESQQPSMHFAGEWSGQETMTIAPTAEKPFSRTMPLTITVSTDEKYVTTQLQGTTGRTYKVLSNDGKTITWGTTEQATYPGYGKGTTRMTMSLTIEPNSTTATLIGSHEHLSGELEKIGDTTVIGTLRKVNSSGNAEAENAPQ